ncbi:protein FAR1-RELATED SEQUENCE 7-like [Silene latifolia]|uniref:protein FAR1-RELATED SEQUENCE 7-like n=1 Tax=Silene latifolia TaxID=37657 RepID=UPI003D772FE3
MASMSHIYTALLLTFTLFLYCTQARECKEVEKRFTPYIGQEFGGVDDAVTFYKIYAIACGFDVRRYTTKKWRGGEIKSKLVVCNREGFAHKKPRKIRMADWMGRIQRGYSGSLEWDRSKTYRICEKEQVNGYENIGASLNDFKNFHRDVKCFINERDVQLFVDHFKEMTETRIGFYFDYDLDDDGSLRRAIWADGTARDNYKIFGDAVSFDPTYSTNKYSMVFTPFTGVDHHKRSVTFCGALIAREDYESFNWVFSRFLIAMGGKEPEYIITDQDPGIIKSFPLVFKTARHRFCMWHIMNKMPNKFGVSRSDYNDFICKIDDIIWDDELEAAEFDGLWEQIVQDHGVGVNDWFADTYAIRGQWRFEHKSGTLVEFWMRFESAMDQQRHTQKQLDNMDKHSSATASTHLALEIHAAKVYTYSAFNTFKQEAFFSIDTCRTGGFTERGEIEITIVKDSTRKKNFEVVYSTALSDDEASGIKTIPRRLCSNRWMKEYLRLRIFTSNGEGTENMQVIDEKQIAISFRQSLSPLEEVLNKNQQMEKFLNCTACEVVTILPPKNSKNKGTGKDSLSDKTKAMVLARKPKRKCKNCKRMANHDKINRPNPFSKTHAIVRRVV